MIIQYSDFPLSVIGVAVLSLLFSSSTSHGKTFPGSYGDAVDSSYPQERLSAIGKASASSVYLAQPATPMQDGGTGQMLAGPSLYNRPTSFVSDPSMVFILARVERQDAAPLTVNGAVYSAGTLFLRADEVLRPGPLKAGEEFAVPFHQRPPNLKRETDQWNELSLTTGSLLLLACKSPDGGKHWQAFSGNNVSSPKDAQVDTLHGAIQIDSAPSAQEKEKRLYETLFGSNDDLADYATGVLSGGELLGTEESARVLASALLSSAMPHERLPRLAFASMNWFADQPPANQAAGRLLAAAVARLMVQTASAKERAVYADALMWAFWDSDHRAAYKGLVAGIDDPPATAVEAALRQVATDTRTTPNPGNRKSYSALLKLWEESHPAR